jgi:hypothetical protein
MGLFETPIILTALAVALVAFVAFRWKGKRRDEWRREDVDREPTPGADR